jgi:hypothetical protein
VRSLVESEGRACSVRVRSHGRAASGNTQLAAHAHLALRLEDKILTTGVVAAVVAAILLRERDGVGVTDIGVDAHLDAGLEIAVEDDLCPRGKWAVPK